MPPVKGARIFPITTLIIVIEVAQLCPTLCDPMDYSPPGSSIHGISQEYWSGLPFPSAGDLPDPAIEPMSPELAGGLFTIEPPQKMPH